MRSSRINLALYAVATLSLGIPFVLIALAQQAMSTQVMAATRVALAAGTLLLVLVFRKGAREHGLAIAARHPVALSVVAVTAAVAPNLLIGAAEQRVPSGTVAVILSTTPVWIFIGSAITKSGEQLRARHWVAMPLALVGVAWACGAVVPVDALPWCLLALAAAISYAISNLVLRRHLAGVSPLLVAAVEMVLASAVLVPFAVTNPGHVAWEPLAWVAVTFAGIACSGLGWLANTALVQRAGASSSSIVSYTSVLVSVVLGVVVLDEPLTPGVGVGCLVLMIAVVIFAGVPPRSVPSWKRNR